MVLLASDQEIDGSDGGHVSHRDLSVYCVHEEMMWKCVSLCVTARPLPLLHQKPQLPVCLFLQCECMCVYDCRKRYRKRDVTLIAGSRSTGKG